MAAAVFLLTNPSGNDKAEVINETVTGYALLVEFSGDSYSENYKLYDRFTVEEGTLKAEFDDTAQTNDRSAFEEGYNYAKSMVLEK